MATHKNHLAGVVATMVMRRGGALAAETVVDILLGGSVGCWLKQAEIKI